MRGLSSLVPQNSPASDQLLAEGAKFLRNNFPQGSFDKVSENIGINSSSNNQTMSAAGLNQAGMSMNSGQQTNTEHKVKLTCSQYDAPEYSGPSSQVGFVASDLSYRIVEFDNMPSISESNTVQYEPIAAPHMPVAFQKYKGTDSITYTIDALFTARNSSEAFRNYVFCLNLKAWTKPFFGVKQMGGDGSRGKLGAPPPVLKFSGFRGLIDVPVVITKLDIPKPNDCDWINTGYNNIPFPTVLKVSIGIIEIYSADQINDFDLSIYRLTGGGEQHSSSTTPAPTTSGIFDPTSAGRQLAGGRQLSDMIGSQLPAWGLGLP